MKGWARLALAGLLMWAASGIARADDLLKAKIGVLRLSSSAPVFIAQDKGYFRDAGLDVELKFFDAAQPIAVATTSWTSFTSSPRRAASRRFTVTSSEATASEISCTAFATAGTCMASAWETTMPVEVASVKPKAASIAASGEASDFCSVGCVLRVKGHIDHFMPDETGLR